MPYNHVKKSDSINKRRISESRRFRQNIIQFMEKVDDDAISFIHEPRI